MSFIDHGSSESLKAGVHAALGGLAVVCVVYNAWAWWARREPHLAANVVLYSAFTTFEARKIARHLCDR